MNDKDAQKPRRPLPMPGSPPAQRPNTPVPTNSPIPSTRLHSSNPPPLPHRPRGVGSNRTTVQTIDEPPTYGSSTSGPSAPEYREPESRLVTEDIMIDDGHPTVTQRTSPGWGTPVWDSALTDPEGYKTWENNWPSSDVAWQSNFLDSGDKTSSSVPVGNRDDAEEMCWWDREAKKRPGRGFLPPILEAHLHNTEHSLLSVSASAPDITPNLPAPPAERDPSQASSSSPQRPAPQRSSHLRLRKKKFERPSPIPMHTSAQRINGWMLLSWKSSSVPPPLSRSGRKEHTLPDQSFRQKNSNCLSPDDNIFGVANKTHHFHRYQNAVDSSQLTPAYRRLEVVDGLKQKRRVGTIIQGELQLVKEQADENMDQDMDETGFPLDLYVCCQCSFYCVASKIISAIIPRNLWYHFIEDRKTHPLPGKSGEHSVATAVETMLT